jgi:hypothetical protein
MRIFVSASSREWQRARFFIASLRLAHHTIEFDWTESIESDLLCGGDADLHPSVSKDLAESCHLGARDCEWFVRLVGPEKSEGSAYEHGVAAGAGRHVIVVGAKDDVARTIMTEMADDTFATDKEALEWIGVSL